MEAVALSRAPGCFQLRGCIGANNKERLPLFLQTELPASLAPSCWEQPAELPGVSDSGHGGRKGRCCQVTHHSRGQRDIPGVGVGVGVPVRRGPFSNSFHVSSPSPAQRLAWPWTPTHPAIKTVNARPIPSLPCVGQMVSPTCLPALLAATARYSDFLMEREGAGDSGSQSSLCLRARAGVGSHACSLLCVPALWLFSASTRLQ